MFASTDRQAFRQAIAERVLDAVCPGFHPLSAADDVSTILTTTRHLAELLEEHGNWASVHDGNVVYAPLVIALGRTMAQQLQVAEILTDSLLTRGKP